jgi:ubiquinone/menaquinone biosynthesis C-methylase UbiE
MTDFHTIYARHAEQYEALVAREDYRGNLLPALQAIYPLYDIDAVEFGAGTGRLTRLLAPLVRTIRAFDSSPAMLDVARALLETQTPMPNWTLGVADNRALPVPDASADLAIAGWTFGHSVGWHPDSWSELIGAMIAEMWRVTRPGGMLIVIETLGTGQEAPAPPPALQGYYAMLEAQGFGMTWIRTDYRFESLTEAEVLTRFFFGEELAAQVVERGWQVLPECTGLWWQERAR